MKDIIIETTLRQVVTVTAVNAPYVRTRLNTT